MYSGKCLFLFNVCFLSWVLFLRAKNACKTQRVFRKLFIYWDWMNAHFFISFCHQFFFSNKPVYKYELLVSLKNLKQNYNIRLQNIATHIAQSRKIAMSIALNVNPGVSPLLKKKKSNGLILKKNHYQRLTLKQRNN